MSASKTRMVNSLLKTRHGIDDPQLAYEIVQLVMTPAEPDRPAGPDEIDWRHPAIVLVKSLTHKSIPSSIAQEIIAKLGPTPDAERVKSCIQRQARGGYDGAWYWLDDYAGTPKASQAQNKIRYVNG